MRENVLGLEVVLANGKIIRTGGRSKKSAAGYDLTKLIVGSEGTLGLITELTLKLQGIPESISAAICSFPSIDNAVRTVIQTIQMGIPMARMELVDSQTIEACNDYFNEDMHVSPHLFLEFHGSEDSVNALKSMKKVLFFAKKPLFDHFLTLFIIISTYTPSSRARY